MAKELWEVVKQENYFTIFKGIEQFCDIDGNPFRTTDYHYAVLICDKLNEGE